MNTAAFYREDEMHIMVLGSFLKWFAANKRNWRMMDHACECYHCW